MGFFDLEFESRAGDKPNTLSGYPIEFLHRAQCQVCPLANNAGNRHPNMKPTGSKQPRVYILGEAPGRQEDEAGRQFVGASGTLLRKYLPDGCALRWNNVVRTRPDGNRDPTAVELECCRPSVVKDIEETKPEAIFGFGNVPLAWAGIIKYGEAGISRWNGRRVPVKIGSHACWYFPMLHPAGILRVGAMSGDERKREDAEFTFALDLERAFRAVEAGLPEPCVHSREDALADVQWYAGRNATDVDFVLEFIHSLYNEDFVGIDLETNRLRPYMEGARILSVALSSSARTVAFPLFHNGAGWSRDELEVVEEALIEFLYHAERPVKIQFSNFEMEWLGYWYGGDVIRAGQWGDAQGQAFVIDERTGTFKLNFVTQNLFGIDIKDLSNVDNKNLEDEPIELVLRYNGVDAKYHRLAYIEQRDTINAEGLDDVWTHHMQSIRSSALSQLKGIPLRPEVTKQLSSKYESLRKEVERGLFALPVVRKYAGPKGRKFQPSSIADCKRILASLGIQLDRNKADEPALAEINHPFAKVMLDWRGINKIISTYIAPCRPGSPYVYPDGCAHPQLNTNRVRTWRTSANAFNYQNFPKHDATTCEVRGQIGPLDPDERVVSFDFAGIQARNIAMESRDPTLTRYFRERYNIHADWRDRILRVWPDWRHSVDLGSEEKNMKQLRQVAKNKFVFPSFFGASGKSVAAYLGIPERCGYRLHDELWHEFPEIRDWQQETREFYRREGYVTGLSNFRRHAPVAGTEIINTPIQSDERIIVLNAMWRLCELGDERLVPNMEIHDDLIFIWHKSHIDLLAPVVIGTMLDVPFEWAHCVPIEVEMSVGRSWNPADMVEVGSFASDTWAKPERLMEIERK